MAAPPLEPALAQALTLATLRSERLRARVLFLTLGAITIGLAIAFMAGGEELLARTTQGRFRWYLPLLHVTPFLLYEALVGFVVLDAFIRRGFDPPALARYANAAVETSAPTVLMLFMWNSTDSPAAFGSVPSLVYFLFIVASVLRLNFGLPLFTGFMAGAQYMATAWWVLPLDPAAEDLLLTPQLHAGKALIMLAAGGVAGLVALRVRSLIVRLLQETEAHQRVTSVFGQHVSPAVVERLLQQRGTETSELREVCVLFLDIANFTNQARERPPGEVVDYLNRAFDAMIESIDRHQGIINKFLGDGFLAVFGAPLDDPAAARNAVAAAREILAEIDRQPPDPAWPLRVRIGIHAGQAVTGNVGSRRRREFTVIGDVVNLASRLEQLNKEFGSRLLVSEAVARRLDEAAGDAPRHTVTVRGYEAPVTVIVLDRGPAAASAAAS